MIRKVTCPLGSECEKVVDNTLEMCAWYTKMEGTDQAGKKHDERRCAISWIPILLVESSSTNRGVAAAVESFRDSQTTVAAKALHLVQGLNNESTKAIKHREGRA